MFRVAATTFNDRLRMKWGMGAFGGSERAERYATLTEIVRKGRAYRFGWDNKARREWELAQGMDDGLRYTLTLWDEYGEGRVDYFTYKTWLDQGLDEIEGTGGKGPDGHREGPL